MKVFHYIQFQDSALGEASAARSSDINMVGISVLLTYDWEMSSDAKRLYQNPLIGSKLLGEHKYTHMHIIE
jgi:hypothetical protein